MSYPRCNFVALSIPIDRLPSWKLPIYPTIRSLTRPTFNAPRNYFQGRKLMYPSTVSEPLQEIVPWAVVRSDLPCVPFFLTKCTCIGRQDSPTPKGKPLGHGWRDSVECNNGAQVPLDTGNHKSLSTSVTSVEDAKYVDRQLCQ